jgi:hypothetical protein
MSRMSLIPPGVVIAMQAALVILVLLATVPIATGGIRVNSDDGANITYNDPKGVLEVGFDADISTNLYFSVDGFRCDVYIVSGDICVGVYNEDDITIPGKGSASVSVHADIPMITVIMMMLYGPSSGYNEAAIVFDVRGSTLGGMISLDANVRTVIAETAVSKLVMSNGTSADTVNRLTATFSVQKNSITDQMFGSPSSKITIGDITVTMTSVPGPDGYDVNVIISVPAGKTLKGSIEAYLSPEQAEALIKILRALYAEWHL